MSEELLRLPAVCGFCRKASRLDDDSDDLRCGAFGDIVKPHTQGCVWFEADSKVKSDKVQQKFWEIAELHWIERQKKEEEQRGQREEDLDDLII